ncbi:MULTISPECIES: transcriptional regulator [unclassified Streptomyces]|uniref:transcriptional regulator n=1 Tax=unclassified Streptomyces TaxID=2593676 RepID=UPI0023670E58|nr:MULTISPECIES: transcriptional regulator [unclassified Streptomyces]MDF3146384.1 transcriptional regulator [Streptomyces sp. T21Q-yed]WDF39096.1 transcriptional regulator [Streptomyces sp. T12]
MSDDLSAPTLRSGLDAAAHGDWHTAYDLLTEADAHGLAGPGDLPVLAEVAYAAGHLDVTIEAWERVHAACVRAGDRVAAAGAAVRVAMHLLFDVALMAPVRGWLARAERLLEGPAENPAWAWCAAVRAYERMLSGDLSGARPWARRAIEVGAGCDPAACAIGRIAEARLMILDGEVRDGLALLDDAGVTAVSGDLDALSTGVVYCELVCALQGLAQYEAAEEWTAAMERWCATDAIGSLHGRCQVHRAEILRLRGAYDEAERVALGACVDLRPYLRREMGWPLSELGRIRLRKGDIEGAEQALLAAHRAGWDPQPGLALVRLAQGDVAAASAAVQDALEHPLRVPSKELPPDTGLRRAPLLEARVEIGIAAGDIEGARAAAGELQRVAARFQSKALIAAATLAQGRVRLAEGAVADGKRLYADAARLWSEVGAPHETALARLGLAAALRAEGSAERAALEWEAARAVLDRAAGTPTEPDPAATVTRPAAPHPTLFRREGDYWSVAFEGRTVRVRDVKGMHYLARLLTHPGREFHTLDLVAAESGGAADRPKLSYEAFGDAGEMLDARAKDAYRRRLTEIDDDLAQARALGDAERAAQAERERDFLVRELSRAVGLGGRDRRAASTSERARVGVTRAVRRAMGRIAEHHPELGEHLDRTVRTGTYCAYLPDPRTPTEWRT